MMKYLKNIFTFLVVLTAQFWSGCTTDYEIEKEVHNWSFVGLDNDSTAVVKVVLEQWGTSHDHHLMGWDDDFHNTTDLKYYSVNINSYKISERLNGDRKMLPEQDSTEEYCIKAERIVDYSTTCAIILQDKKNKNLDTLEIDYCPKENSAETPKFVGRYLKINNCFYKIEKGKFPIQKPEFRFDHKDYSVKFTHADGKFIMYGGEP